MAPNNHKRFKTNHFVSSIFIFLTLSLVLFPCVIFVAFGPSSPVNSLRSRVTNRIEKFNNEYEYPIKTQSNTIFPIPDNDDVRVAMLIVYQGKSLPLWMETLSLTFHLSESIVDWIIIATDPHLYTSRRNIKFIYIDEEDLCIRLTQLDSNLKNDTTMIKQLFKVWPYAFVEFKPCLGTLFSEYLTGYSHWGYADIDQLFGKFDLMIPKQLLSIYDIYTSSFGDNFRAYMRGQFAIYRNNDKINNLWKSCPPYTDLAKRLLYFVHETKAKKWYFESAEGCISKIVANTKDIKVYYGSTQLSDAITGDEYDLESIFLSDTLIRCNEVPLVENAQFDTLLLSQLSQPIIYDLNNINNINTTTQNLPSGYQYAQILNYNCEYWVNPDYQVCLNQIPAYADTIIINGHLIYNSSKY